MALSLSPSAMKGAVDKIVTTNLKLIEAQGRYAEDMFKRNTSTLMELADARITSLQELASARSFTELYDNSIAFESTLRDKLMGLYEENTTATKEFGGEVKELMEVDAVVTKAKALSGELVGKVKSVSGEVEGKVKSLSESALKKFQDLSSSVTGASAPVAAKPKAAPAAKKAAKPKAAPSTKAADSAGATPAE